MPKVRKDDAGQSSPTRDDERDEPFQEDVDEILGGQGNLEEEEEEGEDLFGDNMEDDYKRVPELDKYDAEDLDQEDYSDMEVDERQAAEREMRKRDKRDGRSVVKGRIKESLLYSELSEDLDSETGTSTRAKRKFYEPGSQGDMGTDEPVESIENLDMMKGHSLRDWVKMIGPRTEIYNRFKNFLKTIVDDNGHNVFREKIKNMVEFNHQSLVRLFIL